jgi:hypothetical protein
VLDGAFGEIWLEKCREIWGATTSLEPISSP